MNVHAFGCNFSLPHSLCALGTPVSFSLHVSFSSSFSQHPSMVRLELSLPLAPQEQIRTAPQQRGLSTRHPPWIGHLRDEQHYQGKVDLKGQRTTLVEMQAYRKTLAEMEGTVVEKREQEGEVNWWRRSSRMP